MLRNAHDAGSMLRSTVAVLAVVAALLVAACGDDSDRAATTRAPGTTGTTAPPTTTGTTSQGGIDMMSGGSTDPVHVAATGRETALLTDVRAARHEGYDRVVFEFRNVLPGYDVRYVSGPVREEGSGRVVPIAGGSAVRIRMENALDADLSLESAPLTYTGPRRFAPGTPEVAELARAGGFEGVLTWVAGLQDRVDFRVTTLTAPPRLVVDFRNH